MLVLHANSYKNRNDKKASSFSVLVWVEWLTMASPRCHSCSVRHIIRSFFKALIKGELFLCLVAEPYCSKVIIALTFNIKSKDPPRSYTADEGPNSTGHLALGAHMKLELGPWCKPEATAMTLE